MDVAFKPDCALRKPDTLPYTLWAVTSSNYNYQLLDFCEQCQGEERSFGGVKTIYFPASEDTARTLLEYFKARPTLEVMRLVPHLNPLLTGRLLAEKIRDSVYAEATQSMQIAGLKKALFPFG